MGYDDILARIMQEDAAKPGEPSDEDKYVSNLAADMRKRNDERKSKSGKTPSIGRRFYYSAAYPGNDEKQRDLAREQGFDEFYDKPQGEGGARENVADLVESFGPPILKIIGESVGKNIGMAAGLNPGVLSATGGVINPVTGAVIGGGVGSGAVQGGIEYAAKVRDVLSHRLNALDAESPMAADDPDPRILRETIIGAAGAQTSATLARYGPRALSVLSRTPPAKAAKMFMSYVRTNVANMTRPMQEFVDGQWPYIYSMARKPVDAAYKLVKNQVIKPLKRESQRLGGLVRDTRNTAKTAFRNFSFGGFGDDTANLTKNFVGNKVTRAEGDNLVRISRELERYGAMLKTTERFTASEGNEMALRGKGAEGAYAAIQDYHEYIASKYMDLFDEVIVLERDAKKGFEGLGRVTTEGADAVSSMYAAFNKSVSKRLAAKNSTLEKALGDYHNYKTAAGLVDDYIGTDPKALLNYVMKDLLGEETADNIESRAAAKLMERSVREAGGDTSIITRLKGLATLNYMQGKVALSTGFKGFLATGAASGVGYSEGAVEARLRNLDETESSKLTGRRTRQFTSVAGALTLAHATPETTAYFYKTLEGVGKPALIKALKGAAKWGPSIAARFKGKPLTEAVDSLLARIGKEESAEQ